MISLPPTLNLLCGMVVLFPFAIYSLIIARINRRSRPIVVSGVRDCAGVLLALSGFLFFLWPSLITGFNYWPRDIWLYNHYSSLKGLGHEWWWIWWVFEWLTYVVVVFGGSFVLLWRRRHVTVVYNVEPATLDAVLAHIFNRLGLSWALNHHEMEIAGRSRSVPTLVQEPVPGSFFSGPASPREPSNVQKEAQTVLKVNPWPAFRHVTLHWSSEALSVRRAVDASLRRELAQVRTPENPAGHWLMAICACEFTLLFVLTVLFQISRLRGDW